MFINKILFAVLYYISIFETLWFSGPDSEAVIIEADSSSELKSPISLVHELALKRNLTVLFDVISEKGPPHMRTFVTRCCVGENFETFGEGNGKKVNK